MRKIRQCSEFLIKLDLFGLKISLVLHYVFSTLLFFELNYLFFLKVIVIIDGCFLNVPICQST